MIHYETLYVVHPVHASRNHELKERFQGVLTSQDAEITHVEEWGLRDLAYPIQKQGKGYYNLIQFKASPGVTKELERVMRLSDEVMRCLTVALDDDVRAIVVETEPEPAETPRAEASPASEAEAAPKAEAASTTEADTSVQAESTDQAQS